MLYSEFIENTGCRDNDHNFQVYKNLEVLYMNSEVSKAQIYEYGKKLVDNSKSPEQIEFENSINEQIALLRIQYKEYRADAKRYMQYHKEEPGDTYWKEHARRQRELASDTKRRILDLQWILG